MKVKGEHLLVTVVFLVDIKASKQGGAEAVVKLCDLDWQSRASGPNGQRKAFIRPPAVRLCMLPQNWDHLS